MNAAMIQIIVVCLVELVKAFPAIEQAVAQFIANISQTVPFTTEQLETLKITKSPENY
jgi:hypothetical protein